MIMPFGKHKGDCIEDVPTQYLEWVIDNIHDLDPILRKAIENDLEDRYTHGLYPIGDDDDGQELNELDFSHNN